MRSPVLKDAFDPTRNVRYAVRFLTSLRATTGNWASGRSGVSLENSRPCPNLPKSSCCRMARRGRLWCRRASRVPLRRPCEMVLRWRTRSIRITALRQLSAPD